MVKENEMTLQQALDILESGNSLYREEAYELLKTKYPEEWAKYEQSLKQKEAEASRLWQDIDAVEIITQNQKTLQELSNDYDMGKKSVQKYMDQVAERVNIYEKDEETGRDILLTPERKNDYLKLLFSASKLKIEQELVSSNTFHKADKKAKKEMFESAVDDCVLADLYRVVGASSVSMPKDKETEVGSKSFFKYVKKQSDKFRKIFADAVNTDRKMRINADAVLISVADTAERTKTFSSKLKESARNLKEDARQKLNAVAVHFASRKNRLEEKADKLTNGKYKETIKPVVQSIVKNSKDSAKDNAWKIGTNIAVGGGLAALLGTGAVAAVPVVMAYGAYHAVSSWIWPIVAEKRKAARLAREAGQKLSRKEAWKQGFKNATKKPEGKKINSYVLQGTLNTVLGLAGGAYLADKITALQAAQGAAKAGLAAKAATRVGRTFAPAAAQLSDAGISFISDPNNKTNRQRCRQTALGALITGGIGALTLGLSGGFDTDISSEPVATEGLPGNGSDITSGGNETPDTSDINTAASGVSLFPREWNENMGISERQYNTLIRTMEGTLVDQDGNNITLDRAYMNLTDDVMKKNFPDMTREQVLYKYNRLYAFMRKAHEVSEGVLRERNVEVRFHQYNTEMSELMGLLGCGKAISENHSEAIHSLLHDKFNGILASGKGTNVMTGHTMAEGCLKDGGEWRYTTTPVVSTPEVVTEPEAPQLPVLDDPVVIEDEPSTIEEVILPMEKVRAVNVPAYTPPVVPEPAPEPVQVREINTSNYLDVYGGKKMDVEQNITDTARGKAFLKKVVQR